VQLHDPDVIVTTYPLYQGAVAATTLLSETPVPLVTVVTDLVSLHSVWFSKAAHLCIVPTESARDLALESGLSADRVRVYGIPVHPSIARQRGMALDARTELGWKPNIKTFLAIGGDRVDGLMDAVRVLNHSGLPIQLAVVAGKDDALRTALERIEWHVETHVYGYVSNMPTLMAAADAVISKAGGLTVAETLASGLPMVLVDVLPGQEEGNVQYVLDNGAGAWARTPANVLETIYHWLDGDGKELAEHAARAKETGHPAAACRVADEVMCLAAKNRSAVPGAGDHRLRDLIDVAGESLPKTQGEEKVAEA
jgi:1,2-diacylglycerol 3-beta-galactosyltransferase